jgi:hypothetical protein
MNLYIDVIDGAFLQSWSNNNLVWIWQCIFYKVDQKLSLYQNKLEKLNLEVRRNKNPPNEGSNIEALLTLPVDDEQRNQTISESDFGVRSGHTALPRRRTK